MNGQFGGLDLFVKSYDALPKALRAQLKTPATPEQLKGAFANAAGDLKRVSLFDLLGGVLQDFAEYNKNIFKYLRKIVPPLFQEEAKDQTVFATEIEAFIKDHNQAFIKEQTRTVELSSDQQPFQVDQDTVNILTQAFNREYLVSLKMATIVDPEKSHLEAVRTVLAGTPIVDDAFTSLITIIDYNLWFASRFCKKHEDELKRLIVPQAQQEPKKPPQEWENEEEFREVMQDLEEVSMLGLFKVASDGQADFERAFLYLNKLMNLDQNTAWCPPGTDDDPCVLLKAEIKRSIKADPTKYRNEQYYTIELRFEQITSERRYTLAEDTVDSIWQLLKHSIRSDLEFASDLYPDSQTQLQELADLVEAASEPEHVWPICEKVLKFPVFFAYKYLTVYQAQFQPLINDYIISF